jgi:oligoendopeptidase F
MQEPALKKYQFYIQNLSRSKSHLLALKDTAAAKLIPSAGWYFDQYDNITRKIKFLDIITPAGKLNVRTDKVIISQNTERKIREDGFVKFYTGYDSLKEQYAAILIWLIKSEKKAAQLRNFKSAAEKYYFDKYYSQKTVSLILKQIVDSVSIYKRYQQLRVQNKKKQTGLDEVHYWDMQFSPNQLMPRFTIDTAQKIILAALKPIGAVYQNELFELLNPANRRMEIAPAKNKRSGGFSRGYIGTTSIFYSAAYKGFYDDVRVITHEATHAVHRQLMNTNHVLPVYAAGPNYLFESFAIFSEFLLSDYLMAHAKSKEEKQYFYEQYFDGKGMAMFSIASDALLEQQIHEGVINGTIKTAADFEAASTKVNSLFSIWPVKDYPQLNKRWITASLFYEDPFYEINYVLGAMLALKYYELYKKDGEGFCRKYTALMKNGFNETPQLLLKKFLGIDINSPDLLTGAMKMTKLKVAELEKIYNGQ